MDLKNSFIDWLLKKSFWHGDFRCLILDILKTRKKKGLFKNTNKNKKPISTEMKERKILTNPIICCAF